MRSLVLAIRIKKKNLQAVRSTAKDTEHYSQAFKSYNIPEFPKIRFLLVLSKSDKSMRKFRPNLSNDSLVLTIIITELFRSHSFFFLKIRLKLDRLLKPQSYPISAIDKEESTKAREAAPKRISVRKSIKLLEVCCLIKRQNEASLIFTILATSARRITSENENEHNPAPCSTSR